MKASLCDYWHTTTPADRWATVCSSRRVSVSFPDLQLPSGSRHEPTTFIQNSPLNGAKRCQKAQLTQEDKAMLTRRRKPGRCARSHQAADCSAGFTYLPALWRGSQQPNAVRNGKSLIIRGIGSQCRPGVTPQIIT